MKIKTVFFGLVLFVYFASCASAPETNEQSADLRQYTIIDSKAMAMGIDIPRWYEAAGTSYDKVRELYPNNEPVVVQRSGINLDGVRLLTEGFDVAAELSRSLTTSVSDLGGRAVSGDSAKIKEAAERFTAIASKSQFSGLRKEADFWVLRKFNSDGREEYLFTVLYLLPKNLYDQQITEMLNKMSDEDKGLIQPLVERAKQELGVM